jgi:antitoxin YefM
MDMSDTLVPTSDFSPAKAHLSEVMTQVFHGHQPQLVSRHRGKEQMLLLRPDDLVAMLADHHLEVMAVYDEDDVTLRIPDLGVLGFGETLDDAIDDLIVELRAYAARFFRDSARFMATGRATHAGVLLRFALSSDEEQQRMVREVREPAPVADLAVPG